MLKILLKRELINWNTYKIHHQECNRVMLPFLSPGDLPDPGIEPRSPALQADSLPSEPPGKPLTYTWNLHMTSCKCPSVWQCTVFSWVFVLGLPQVEKGCQRDAS